MPRTPPPVLWQRPSPGRDIFLGVSGHGLVTQEMLKTMAAKPMIMALANPIPEIMPEMVKEVRPDAIVATGRSDYPNQVNNVLCFPYIFRARWTWAPPPSTRP